MRMSTVVRVEHDPAHLLGPHTRVLTLSCGHTDYTDVPLLRVLDPRPCLRCTAADAAIAAKGSI